MSDEIRVKVHSYGAGRPLGLVYFDPITGKKVAKSSGTYDDKEAERAAAVLEDELRSGRYQAASKVTWEQFIERYTDEKLATLAPSTRETALTSLAHLKRVIGHDRLCKITPAIISRFQGELRKPRTITREVVEKGERTTKKVTLPPMKDTTIAHHLRHVKAALRWAFSVGMMPNPPKVVMPKRAKGQTMARARAVTTEEYERMLVDAPKVRKTDSAEWIRLIEGLWLSGLRLGEAVALSWDEGASFSVDVLGKRPVFRILSEGQKSGRDEVLPMTPDFAEFLFQTPEAERVGRVFNLVAPSTGKPIARNEVGRIVAAIGKKAKVVTNKAEGKFASAHDLRRGFGNRWARRVMPAVLQRLMRHSAIQTTMAYYVDLDAGSVAEDLWAKFGGAASGNNPGSGNTSGNNQAETEVSTTQGD